MLLGTLQPASIGPGTTRPRDTKRLRAAMRRGLRRHEFAVTYQPRLDLGTGAVKGCEAKLRWPGRIGGVLAPQSFLAVAHGSEVMDQLDAFALEEACAHASAWGGKLVSVNVSGRRLASGGLADQVASALERAGLAPENLELELPETAVTNADTGLLLALCALRDIGVGLALDDFGAGVASLATLKRLPLTTLKLDQSLIRALPGSREDASIVHAMVQMAHAIGLTVVAEGVETEFQRAYLAALGCDEGQGPHLACPLPAEKVRPFLAYCDETCSGRRSAPETRHERTVRH